MAAYTAGQVSISNGSKAVVINSDENPESVAKGDFLFLSGSDPKEINRTYINDQQKHVIELIENWDSGNKTNQPAIVLPTTVEFRDTVAAIKNANLLINDNMQAMSDWQSKLGTVTFIGLDGTERTVPTLASFLATLGTAATKDVTTSPTDTTAGRLLTVGYMGLGATTQPEVADLNNVPAAGFHPVRSGITLNNPLNTYHSSVLRMNSPFIGRGGELLITNSSSDVRALIRGEFGSVNSDWQELYHSGNTNFTTLKGENVGDQLGGIVYRNTNTLFMVKEISGYTSAPSSITCTGTFKITNQSGVDRITGITASDILLDVLTTSKRLKLRINNVDPTVLTFGGNETYELSAETAGAEIEVNP